MTGWQKCPPDPPESVKNWVGRGKGGEAAGENEEKREVRIGFHSTQQAWLWPEMAEQHATNTL